MTDDAQRIEHWMAFAADLARSAGAIIRADFMKGGVDKVWQPDNTPLTQTDLAVHRLVLSGVRDAYPSHSLLSEENKNAETHIVDGAEYVWVCDPIDGTLPFSHGLPISTFSLALVRDGKVILGTVYDPFLDRLFAARVGGGAFLNGTPIRVSPLTSLRTAVIDLEGVPEEYDGAVYHALRDRSVGAKVITQQSTAMAGCLVAAGSYSALVFGRNKPWDVAAIKVIVEEAGGRTTDLYGRRDQRYDRETHGFVAANGGVHDAVIGILAGCREVVPGR
jgi:fructose-1,6-bisphosphatase/inositol monophosphatase family enzyme